MVQYLKILILYTHVNFFNTIIKEFCNFGLGTKITTKTFTPSVAQTNINKMALALAGISKPIHPVSDRDEFKFDYTLSKAGTSTTATSFTIKVEIFKGYSYNLKFFVMLIKLQSTPYIDVSIISNYN